MKKMKSRLLCGALTAILAAGMLAGCGKSGSQPSAGSDAAPEASGSAAQEAVQDKNEDVVQETTEAAGERTVVVGISGDPVTFVPWNPNTDGRKNILFSIYQQLAPTAINPETGKFEADYVLMSGYDHEPGTMEYTIHIRDGIKDSLGNTINANDVKFSYEQAAASGYNNNAASVSEYEVVDDLTIKFKFDKVLAVGAFDDIISDVFVVSQASYEASPDGMATMPIGSSGYVLTDYQPGVSATIEKGDFEYWNEAANISRSGEDGFSRLYDTTNVDKVVFNFITEASTMAVALENGEIDVANTISDADAVLFREGGAESEDFNAWTFASDCLSVVPNCSEKSPMSNINLRKALFYSFDNASIMYSLNGADGKICYSWDTPARADYNPKYETEDYFGYNVDTAKEYLNKYFEESGTSASDLHLVILCSNQGSQQKAAQLVQNYFCEMVGSDNAMEVLCVDDSILKSTWGDETAFDVVLDAEATETVYSSNTWRKSALASAQANGMAMFFNADPKVQELLIPACDEATHNQETCDAFNDYMIEQAYRKCIGYGVTYRVAADWVGQIYKGPKSSIAITGMSFDWAAKEQK